MYTSAPLERGTTVQAEGLKQYSPGQRPGSAGTSKAQSFFITKP